MVDREWMYTGWTGSGRMNDEFVTETANFLELAFSRAKGDYALCPCAKCMNTRKQKKDEMTRHLCLYGFVSNYTVWTHHGEHERARAEVLRQRTDDIEGPGVGDMIDDYHDAHFPEDEESRRKPRGPSLICWTRRRNLFTSTRECLSWMPYRNIGYQVPIRLSQRL